MSRPIPSTAPPNAVSVVVMRPDDTVGAICLPAWEASKKKGANGKKKRARYRCGRCLKGLVPARIGSKCKVQACHAEVVDVIKRPDRAMLIPRRRGL